MSGRRSFPAKEELRREVAERVEAAKRDGTGSVAYVQAVSDPECLKIIRREADYFLDVVVNPAKDDQPQCFLLFFAEHVEFWKLVYAKDMDRFRKTLQPFGWLKNHSGVTLGDGTCLASLPWWPHK